ncbi:hypothetical protein NLJ89_g10822 [Agrocybe chaxingu]|uniref:Uncharacterized protein n=1 Tax=Agrocybe chaxingu TaxID=84603 RepID=A0A9W8JQI8_9AGAR|nr:hypothetical protein NLJ89_g10822 [Agrocybe chaxingu]
MPPLPPSTRPPYKGTRRKLVLAFDVGTTYSGISYRFLLAVIINPRVEGLIPWLVSWTGRVPEVKGVTRFPAHEQTSGTSKIPTLIYYNGDGEVCAVGAEATVEDPALLATIRSLNNLNGALGVRFKPHLRSKTAPGRLINEYIPPLPPNKSIIEAFADFLLYLLQCASKYIQDTHPNGPRLWSSVEDSIDFVLSHPNGWEGMEQNQIRKAAVLAGLIPDSPSGHARIRFVTEGEASLHFAVQQGILVEAMEGGNAVVVVDAGGGTIDVSSYTSRQGHLTRLLLLNAGHFYGSLFVSIHARVYLQHFLADSPYLDDIEHIVECFDDTTKMRFKSDTNQQYIKFGSTRDNDATYNIRFGQLKLDGADVAGFFQPSVLCIVNAVLEQRRLSRARVQSVLMVGGFSSNDWLLQSVQYELGKYGLHVFRPADHINKAVSDGAVSFYFDNVVRVRVSKVTFGTLSSVEYNRKDPDQSRARSIFLDHSGDKRLPDQFNIVLRKNTQISEATEFRQRFDRVYSNRSDLRSVSTVIWCYRGTTNNPVWKSDDPGHYSELCTITADLSHM